MSPQDEKNWKLKLRYGKIKTIFNHFTILADGVVDSELKGGFNCPSGRAWMSMKVWAKNVDEAVHMIQDIGMQIGFTVNGKIYIHDTEPTSQPEEEPYGYDIDFKPYVGDN